MPGWLDQWIKKYIFQQQPGSLGDINNSLGDLATSLRTYFAGILNALLNLAGSARDLRNQTGAFNQAVAGKLWWLYRWGFVALRQQVFAKFLTDERWESQWHDRIAGWIADVRSSLASDIASLIKWVTVAILIPFTLALHTLAKQMIEWAFAAWDLLTHPPRLAGILFWPLFGVLAADPWAVGRTIGDWLVKLVYQNMLRSVTLLEQIMADVL